MPASQHIQQLYEDYTKFKEEKLLELRVKPLDYAKAINKHLVNPLFKANRLGYSFEGRPIYHLTYGHSPTKLLLWSQMHGNEATATLAIADILNFLSTQNDNWDTFRQNIFQNLEIHFVPMLNPDGAERFNRRNAQGIDLNRDALKLVSFEARLLKQLRDKTNPQFALNLHDQELYYTAGLNGQQTAMSFLAPSFNSAQTINTTRQRAINLIGYLYEQLTTFIPNKIARYNADYTPNAFGESMMRWQTASVLIESGSLSNDKERSLVRKLNFVAILGASEYIANNQYNENKTDKYNQIPINVRNNTYDLLIKNLTVCHSKCNYTIDIAIKRTPTNPEDFTDYLTNYRIENIGDLSACQAIKIFDAAGYKLKGNYNDIYITRAANFEITNGSTIVNVENIIANVN